MSQERTWEFNGVVLDADFEDADFMETCEEAFRKMSEREKKLQKDGTKSGIIREYCLLFYDFFDQVYGAGTGMQLFQGRYNSRLCDECYGVFLDAIRAAAADTEKRKENMRLKYNPGSSSARQKPQYNNVGRRRWEKNR